MTRLEAYRYMLEGKKVTHPLLSDSKWSVDSERVVRVDGSLDNDWNCIFFSVQYLSTGWSLYEPY